MLHASGCKGAGDDVGGEFLPSGKDVPGAEGIPERWGEQLGDFDGCVI